MKGIKLFMGAASTAIMLGFTGPALAQSAMTGTPHDLSGFIDTTLTPAEQQGQICIFCHIPHGGSTDAPLWNRTLTTQSFTTYSSATLTGTTAPAPAGVSLACLSCHDGSVAFNALTVTSGLVFTAAGGNTMGAVPANLGTDLTNDHPVSITYDPVADGGLEATPLNNVPLYGAGTVECGSCHNPHDWATNGKFLRVTRANSTICISCHTK